MNRTFCLLAAAVLLALPSPRLLAWGAMHSAITQGALEVLPAWQQELLAGQREDLITFDCMIPDLAQAPAHKALLGPFVVLPNGEVFSHLPHKTREANAYQISYYFHRVVETVQARDFEKAARWAGCLLHFLEDSGSPAHTMPGDNQMGLLKDLLPTPETFRNQPLHGLIEEGSLPIHLTGYRPQLLGTTSDEAVVHLMERYNAMVCHARAQVIPILEGTYRGAQDAIDAGQLRAATMDAQVVADALYTALSIAEGRFDSEEAARLAIVDLSALTPLEVINQSYFPQHTFFSDPYFGFPLRDGILGADKQKQPLVLQVFRAGQLALQEFPHGLGLGSGSRLTYALPAEVYDQFECLVGLHATLGREGRVVFRVLLDGATVYESPVLAGEAPAQKVTVPIWGARELTLLTESRNPTRGHNYTVIAAPALRKTTDPQKLGQRHPAPAPGAPPFTYDEARKLQPSKVE